MGSMPDSHGDEERRKVAMTMRSIVDLQRALKAASAKSARLCAARAALPAGISRARVTTANARWMRAAEERDRIANELAGEIVRRL
jgi:hypothetical protein